MKPNKTTRANRAKKVSENKVNNATTRTAEAIPVVEAVDVDSVPAAAFPVVKETTNGKVSSKEVLKAAGSLRAAVKEERRGANCTIRLIAERAAAGDAAAINVLCALCDVPREALFSITIEKVREAVNTWYPYYIEAENRKVSVKHSGVWYTDAREGEEIEDAAKRVARGFFAKPVDDYLEQLITAAKSRAKGINPRKVEAESVYMDNKLSEAAAGVTASDLEEAKKRKAYLANAVNVWHKHSLIGFYI